ncbi:hypothetical protein [Streptomyces lydicus]|uniref:hypothetical protein n=1 Tax=Streptomyces lydicus TaxID=47763 RepID=UPI0036E29DA8
MGAAWVAGVTRARGMLVRRLGVPGARRIAAAGTLDDALHDLATASSYRCPASDAAVPTLQREVTASLLWHLRVLAGWLPRRGVECLRLLASGFEIANIEAHLRRVSGSNVPQPYAMGALSTVWNRLAGVSEPEALRAAVTASPWRDPGDTAASMAVTLRLTAAARTAARIPPAVRWSAGRAALLVARERFVHGRPLPATADGPAVGLLGPAAVRASAYDNFCRSLPATAGWALHGIDDPADLWRAEGRWWRDIEQDGLRLASRARYDMVPVVGAVAVLSADAWRTRAVLELVADDTAPPEDFDALA